MRKALRVAAKAALGAFTVRVGICLLLLMTASPCLPKHKTELPVGLQVRMLAPALVWMRR